MNGHMAEAQDGFAVLEDVDVETFARFIQWAYSGYYAAPEFSMVVAGLSSEKAQKEGDPKLDQAPKIREDALSTWPNPSVDNSYDDGWSVGGYGGSKAAKWGKKSKNNFSFDQEPTTEQSSKEALKESFVRRKTTVRRESTAMPPPRPNQGPHEDYSNIFLSHARLHVFADKYDVQKLKLLALEELQTTLAIFTLYSERTGDITKLLRYIYENSGESVPGVEDLRTLMTLYVGFEMDTLMKDEGFKELIIDDGGPLLGDFMSMVGKRI